MDVISTDHKGDVVERKGKGSSGESGDKNDKKG